MKKINTPILWTANSGISQVINGSMTVFDTTKERGSDWLIWAVLLKSSPNYVGGLYFWTQATNVDIEYHELGCIIWQLVNEWNTNKLQAIK